MTTPFELVFGVGYQLDAIGNPIERGLGNLTDREKAEAVAKKIEQLSAAADAPAPQPVPSVATPVTPIVVAGAPAPHKSLLIDQLKEKLQEVEQVEAAIEDEVKKL